VIEGSPFELHLERREGLFKAENICSLLSLTASDGHSAFTRLPEGALVADRAIEAWYHPSIA
jgi:argonaute-like protein implicated in RNA metabolism and viral defense